MIREARDEDFEVIASITNEYVRDTSIHFGYEPVSPDELRASWREGAGRYPWLVAERHTGEAAVVIGYAKAGVWRARAAYRWTTEVGLYVAPVHHRRGVGRALYTALLDELARRGFRSAIAGITLPNDASLALHEALGFEPVGTVQDAGYKLGAWHAVAFFQKRFATGPEGPADLT